MLLEGRAFCFGNQVTTDDILPGRYLDRRADEVAQFAMAGVDPTFAARVRPGDFVVAGANFGAGSGRESAPAALKGAGVAAVVASSFSRLFFRNCINLGLPPVLIDETADSSRATCSPSTSRRASSGAPARRACAPSAT